MKLPKGKTAYIGGKKYKAGDEIPDELVKKLNVKSEKPAPKKPAAGEDKPTVKP